MLDEPTKAHAIYRTSPKGGPFLGTCSLCGKTGLSNPWESNCINIRGLTQGEALLEALDQGAPNG